jgi:hypothetical protein
MYTIGQTVRKVYSAVYIFDYEEYCKIPLIFGSVQLKELTCLAYPTQP